MDADELGMDPGSRRGGRREYRSSATLWGWPLIHVVTSGNPNRMALARGIIAIGDTAVGLIAVGGFAFGGVTLAGMSIGVVGLSGITVGLLLAFGGIAAGGLATGSLAVGLVGNGVLAESLLPLAPESVERVAAWAWGLGTLLAVAATAFVIWAFSTYPPRRLR